MRGGSNFFTQITETESVGMEHGNVTSHTIINGQLMVIHVDQRCVEQHLREYKLLKKNNSFCQ